MADRNAEVQVVKGPEPFDEGPEALLEMYGSRKSVGEFGVIMLDAREVFEEVEDKTVFVVQGGVGGYDCVVELA